MSVEESEGTRATLLRAAAQLLEREGVAAVALRAVGAQAGVSRTAPYRHFADKVALLSALAAADLYRLRDALATAADGIEDTLARLEAMTQAYVAFALVEPQRHRLMFGGGQRKREHADMQQAGKAALEVLVGAVAHARRAGTLPGAEPAPLAALLWSTGHGVADLTLAGYTEPVKGLGDPASLLHLLLAQLRR